MALQLLLHCGLLGTLEAAGRSTDRALARRAGALLRALLELASSERLMPAHQRLQLLQLGTLTTHAMRLRTTAAHHLSVGAGAAAATGASEGVGQWHDEVAAAADSPTGGGGDEADGPRETVMVGAMLGQVALVSAETTEHAASEALLAKLAWRREWEYTGLVSELQAQGALGRPQVHAHARGRIELLRMQAGSQLDESSLAAQLRETGVLASRSYTEWNWLVLEQLLRGPLRHPARLVKVMGAIDPVTSLEPNTP